jgi:hypothetical protein
VLKVGLSDPYEPWNPMNELSECAREITTSLMALWYEKEALSSAETRHLEAALIPLSRVNSFCDDQPLMDWFARQARPNRPLEERLTTLRSLLIIARNGMHLESVAATALQALSDSDVEAYSEQEVRNQREVGALAAGALVYTGQSGCRLPRAIETLRRYLEKSPPDHLAQRRILAYPPESPEGLLPYLVRLRELTPAFFARAIAILAMGRQPGAAERADVLNLLEQEVWRSSAWITGAIAAEMLWSLGVKERLRHMAEAVNADTPEARNQGCRLLARLGPALQEPEVETRLRELLRSSDVGVAMAALEAITMLPATMRSTGEAHVLREAAKAAWVPGIRWTAPATFAPLCSDALLEILRWDRRNYSAYQEQEKEANTASGRIRPPEVAREPNDSPPIELREEPFCVVYVHRVGASATVSLTAAQSASARRALQAYPRYADIAGRVYLQSEREALCLTCRTEEDALQCAVIMARIGEEVCAGPACVCVHRGVVETLRLDSGGWRLQDRMQQTLTSMAQYSEAHQIVVTGKVTEGLAADSFWQSFLKPIAFAQGYFAPMPMWNMYAPGEFGIAGVRVQEEPPRQERRETPRARSRLIPALLLFLLAIGIWAYFGPKILEAVGW